MPIGDAPQGSQAAYLAYIILSLLPAVFLGLRTERPLLWSALIYWMWVQPIAGFAYTLRVHPLSFDLQPNRVLLLFLAGYALFRLLASFRGSAQVGDSVERRQRWVLPGLLSLYVLVVGLSLWINIESVRPQSLVVVPSWILCALLLVVVVSSSATDRARSAVLWGLIGLSLASCVVSVVQIAVDPFFLKACPPRPAFGSVIRASGLFESEYDCGYVMICAMAAVLCKIRPRYLRFSCLGILILGLLLTFHRMDYIIMVLVLSVWLMLFSSAALRILGVVSLLAFAGMAGGAILYLQSTRVDSDLIRGRLQEDTVTGRLAQFRAVIESAPEQPFGLGDYSSQGYYDLMAKHNMLFGVQLENGDWEKRPFLVHNGYVEVLALHGIPAAAIFLAIMVWMVLRTSLKIRLARPETAFPFVVTLVWAICNLSNGISRFELYFPLFVMLVFALFDGVPGRAPRSSEIERGKIPAFRRRRNTPSHAKRPLALTRPV